MSTYRQNGIWWYEIHVEGKRFRSSTRTTDKALAQRVEAEHYQSLKRVGIKISSTLDAIKVEEASARRAKIWEGKKIQTDPPQANGCDQSHLEMTPRTLLQEAGEFFLRKQQERCRQKTLECNEGNLRRLVEFFGNIPLAQFTVAHFEHYQSVRGAMCSASAVNHELNVLSRILRRVDLWFEIKRNYSPLKDVEWKRPRIFNADEQARIFRAIQSNPNLELAAIAFTITRNTTASGCELRGLRLGSLELEAVPPRIHIPPDSTKNNVRPRSIPLNEDAFRACQLAMERANRLGSHYPEDYLFPLRIDRATWDPKRPASRSWLRKQVELLREVTGIEHINPHTFRHLAVTELLEKGAPEQTVIALAGWVSRRMIETYSHTRMEAKSDAVELLSTSGYRYPQGAAHSKPDAPQPWMTPLPASVDLMKPAIQAEIARQVALALQRAREDSLP